jgi:predicted transposase YbfD/YdcC
MQSVVESSGGKLLAIDGKSIRRSFEHGWEKSGMAHMVSLFVQNNGLVFSQLKTEGKGTELAGIIKILGLADLRGATVTIDAIGCQKQVAKLITERGGDYILCVKENQKSLHDAVKGLLDEMILEKFKDLPHGTNDTTNAGHGRIERRCVWCTDQIQWLKMADEWAGLRSIAVIESTRDLAGAGKSTERRYYISSIANPDAQNIAQAIRGHWGIENSLHHVLDVSFHEDDSRIRKNNAAENVSRLRRIALNALKQKENALPRRTKKKKPSIRTRRKIAAWDHDYLLRLIMA